MNDDQVLISTHDLSTAGLLRDGFKSSGYSTDLVTPDEDLSVDDGAVLLVLTGVAEKGENPLVIQARDKLQKDYGISKASFHPGNVSFTGSWQFTNAAVKEYEDAMPAAKKSIRNLIIKVSIAF